MNKRKKKLTMLVTGGAGFIGSTLADRLIREGHRVVVVDDLSSGKREYVPRKASFRKLDIADSNIADVIKNEKPDGVFHLAAQIDVRTSVDDPVRDARINVIGALRLLEACARYGVKKFVFASSGGAIYGSADIYPTPETAACLPESPYGVAKLAFEHYLRCLASLHGLTFAAMRFANVYGPRQDLHGEAGVIGIFVRRALDDKGLAIYGDGRATRDYVFVDDVVDALVRAMKSGKSGVFNVGTGVETSVNRIAELVRSAVGADVPVDHLPARSGEVARSSLDNKAARRALGWKPRVGIEKGIRLTAAWFRNKSLSR